jgi:hypothetical protein
MRGSRVRVISLHMTAGTHAPQGDVHLSFADGSR